MATKQQVMGNMLWRFLERFGASLVSFVVQIVIARLLSPEHYGTIALVSVFITILNVFVDSGLGNALIQKKNADNLDFSTVFYTNLVFCTTLYLLLFFLAPVIASFYDNQSLTSIIRVLGITILISGVKNIEQAYVSSKMMFRKFFFATLAGTITAAIVGIVLAYNGFGVWALVAQQLINAGIDTVVLWFTVKWRPSWAFSFQRLKSLFSFGWKLLVSALLDTTYNQLRQLIIGKKYTDTDLGYYNKGKQIPEFVITNVNSSIDSVLFPAMSQVQNDSEKVKEITRKSIKVSIYIIAPMMIGMAAVAENLIRLLLTDKWVPAAIYLQIFCVSFIFYPIHTANLNAIKSMGRSDYFLILEIIKKVVGIGILFATMWFGPVWIAFGMVVSGFISQFINSFPNKKLLNYSFFEQIKDLLPSLLLSILMGGIVYAMNYIPSLPYWCILIVQVTTGVLVYWLGSVLFKNKTYRYLLETIKQIINKRRLTKMNKNNFNQVTDVMTATLVEKESETVMDDSAKNGLDKVDSNQTRGGEK